MFRVPFERGIGQGETAVSLRENENRRGRGGRQGFKGLGDLVRDRGANLIAHNHRVGSSAPHVVVILKRSQRPLRPLRFWWGRGARRLRSPHEMKPFIRSAIWSRTCRKTA